MKFILILIQLISISLISTAQNLDIPDANFKAALISLGVDTNGDNEISVAEAEARTTLYVHSKKIADLTGIEAFVNLTELYCHFNDLTSLNISTNTALQTLFCNYNKLESIDVSKNTALKTFYINDNLLTAVDLSANTELTSFTCDNNQISTIDVSNNNALTYLGCAGNNISALNVSNLKALTGLVCGANQLTTLDISNNTALRQLECSRNQFTSLNISNNTSLKYIYFYDMPFLINVCVWTMPFPPASVEELGTTGSPNIVFTDICNVSISKKHLKESSVKIGSNPHSKIITINMPDKGNYNVELFDLSGKKVYSNPYYINNENINVANLRNGIYLVIIKDKHNKLTRKIVIQ